MSVERTVGVGLLGIGEHARRNLLPGLAAAHAVGLVGLHGRNAAAAGELAATHDCRAYDSAEAMLDDDAVDAVVVALPNDLHRDAVATALAAGKHVWCEKPLTLDRAATETLLADAETRGLTLAECFMFVYHRQFERLCTLVADGAVGTLQSVTARFGIPHRDPGDFRYDAARGGGALGDVGSYPVRFATALLGNDPLTVAATIASENGYAVDITGSALVSGGSAARALLDWGFGRAYRNDAEIWGSTSTMTIERPFSKPPDLATTIRIRRADGREIAEPVPADNHFARQFEHFAGAVTDAGRRLGLHDAVRRQATLMDLVRRAGRDGATVTGGDG